VAGSLAKLKTVRQVAVVGDGAHAEER
jgi:hypothetical protein